MTMSNICSKATGSIETESHIESLWAEGTKICSNRPGHMTNLITKPIMIKTLINLQLQNKSTDSLETEYVALGTSVLLRLFKL